MNLYSSLLHGVLFVLFFTLLAMSDWLLQDQRVQHKHFLIEQDTVEELAEMSESALAPATHVDVPDQVLKELFELTSNSKSITSHQWFTTSNLDEKRFIVTTLSAWLVGQKQFSELVQLISTVEPATIKGQVSTLFHYATALSRLGQISQSIQVYQQLIDVQPNHQSALINLALLYRKGGLLPASIVTSNQAVRVSSGERKAKALSILASNYRDSGQAEKAVALFRKSIEFRPDHAATWLKLANAQVQADESQQSVIKTFQRSVALAPSQYRPRLEAGQYALRQGLYGQAHHYLTQAFALTGEQPAIMEALGWTLVELGDWEGSKSYWQWMQRNAQLKSNRLLAKHMLLAADQQNRESLKPIKFNNKNKEAYIRAVLTQRSNSNVSWQNEMKRVQVESIWYLRAQKRLSFGSNVDEGTGLLVQKN